MDQPLGTLLTPWVVALALAVAGIACAITWAPTILAPLFTHP